LTLPKGHFRAVTRAIRLPPPAFMQDKPSRIILLAFFDILYHFVLC
jgi:hypothetical protein